MKKYLMLVILCLFLLSGCAIFSSNITFTPVDGLSDVKISSRTAPAKISMESNTVLETKGYAYIGFVRLVDEVKSCWDKECQNFACADSLPHKDMIKEVLDKAASQGGDLLVLESNAKPEISSTQKEGSCVSWADRDVQVSYCCKQGKGYCESTCYRTQRQSVCVAHASIYGKKCSFVTSGKVWRHEPDLGKRLAAFQRERAIMQLEKEKISAQITTLKKAYEEDSYTFQKGDLVSVKVGGKYGFKDRNGKMIIKPQFTDTMYGFSDGVAVVSVGEKDEKKWGIINKAGKWVMQPSYKSMGKPSNGMVVVKANNKCGYVNTKGQLVIDAQFTTCWSFSEGMSAVRPDIKNKVGYIDKTGKMVIGPQFDLGGRFSDGLAAVKVDRKYGYIDKKGNFIIKPQFDYADHFVKGIARVKDGNQEKYINRTGEIFMKP